MKATVYPVGLAAPCRIAIVPRPRGGDWLCDELTALSREGIDVLVSMLTHEEAKELGLQNESSECQAAGLEFVNIPIFDRSVPADRDGFVNEVDGLVDAVRQGRSLGVHCRASIGRASILVASILVRMGYSAAEAFAAAELARGCPVPDTPEQREWVIERLEPAPNAHV